MELNIQHDIVIIKTEYTQPYSFGAGYQGSEPRLLIYNLQESQHYDRKTSLEIIKALLRQRAYIIENTRKPPSIAEFIKSSIYTRVDITPEEAVKLKEIREYLNGRLRPTWKADFPTHQGPDS